MYSLYRAWLSMSTQPPEIPPLNLSAPATSSASSTHTTNAPDVQLQVGPSLTNFSAHRNVLAVHSGFFKAALNNFTAPTAGGGGGGSGPIIGPILVPNIAVDEFSSLLTFMYTGYLDLNITNIYNILLATHILHMPRALELCRNFLMQQQQQQQQIECHQPQPPTSSSSIDTTTPSPAVIIKPIPSRKPLPNIEILCEKQRETEKKIFKNSVFKVYKNSPPEDPKEVRNEPSTSSAKQDTIQEKREKLQEKTAKKEKKRRISHLVAPAACSIAEEQRVIVDIACCDGPVRFHRIVNKNYGLKASSPVSISPSAVTTVSASGEDETSLKRQRTSTLAAINKIMTENIKLASSGENNTAAETKPAAATQPPPAATAAADLYTCLYCNHTFKSQYCYQKHARRHLNPVDAVKTPIMDAPISSDKQHAAGSCGSSGGAAAAAAVAATKREFKLLDMNVQYYPCKTCGSKFPSYYFVHKHRKLCHADEMADGSNKNNEIVQVKPKKSAKSSPATSSTSTTTAAAAASNNDDDENSTDKNAKLAAVAADDEDDTTSDIIDVEETN